MAKNGLGSNMNKAKPWDREEGQFGQKTKGVRAKVRAAV